jgi:hypothetical protein
MLQEVSQGAGTKGESAHTRMESGGFGLLSRFLGGLFSSRDDALSTDTAKNETNAEPLHGGEGMTEPEDREDHGEHLARDSDGDEEERGEGGEGVNFARQL